jgi:hypothetical protein
MSRWNLRLRDSLGDATVFVEPRLVAPGSMTCRLDDPLRGALGQLLSVASEFLGSEGRHSRSSNPLPPGRQRAPAVGCRVERAGGANDGTAGEPRHDQFDRALLVLAENTAWKQGLGRVKNCGTRWQSTCRPQQRSLSAGSERTPVPRGAVGSCCTCAGLNPDRPAPSGLVRRAIGSGWGTWS